MAPLTSASGKHRKSWSNHEHCGPLASHSKFLSSPLVPRLQKTLPPDSLKRRQGRTWEKHWPEKGRLAVGMPYSFLQEQPCCLAAILCRVLFHPYKPQGFLLNYKIYSNLHSLITTYIFIDNTYFNFYYSFPTTKHIHTQFISAKLKKGRKWKIFEPLLCDQYYDEYLHACQLTNPHNAPARWYYYSILKMRTMRLGNLPGITQ